MHTRLNPRGILSLPFALWLALSLSATVAWGQVASDVGGDGFPEVYNSETEPGDPISPQQALQSLHLAPGFEATLFAAEPEIQNPIAACTDAQGRVWIAENYTYAERSQRFDLALRDRVVVLEDDDGDGVADRRTVFTDQLQRLTGIVVGRSGVWVMCPPQLLFIPDADGDLHPDGPPQAKLTGFEVARENYHNFANGLSWGPDNWLYGRCGASCAGEVGLPGSTAQERVPVRGGMWRFHPERGVYESLTHGTTNPWGHDWNALGDLFFINTVNGHLWHAIPGAHFVRSHTLDSNPHSYELLDTHADHWHFDTGKGWTASRAGAANDYGGGHAHIGMLIYQEDLWPETYRGGLMTVNMHGRRINMDRLERNGSGYVGRHAPDVLSSDDTWFRGMELLPLPDGNALLIDWSDTGECHEHTGVHRTSGRIFKIVYDAPPHQNPLASSEIRQSPAELAKLQATGTTWQSRRARELLCEMALRGGDTAKAVESARHLLQDRSQPVDRRLRGAWTLASLDAVDREILRFMMTDANEAVRGWGIRLWVDDWRIDNSDGRRPLSLGASPEPSDLEKLVKLAGQETSPAVRLTLASVLQRLPHNQRPALAKALLSHPEDADDHNLPLMVWYGLTPLGDTQPAVLLDVLDGCHWPVTRRLLARRIADQSPNHPDSWNGLVELAIAQDTPFQADVVRGIGQALAGWQQAVEPEGWQTLREGLQGVRDPELQAMLQSLSILFGDGRTVQELIQIADDDRAALDLRKSALQSLVDARAEGLRALCLRLLSKRFLNSVAAAGLARERDPEIGSALVQAYRRFHPEERPQVLSILASRRPWAKALLRAVEQGKIDRSEISAFQARQIASLDDAEVDRLLVQNWGQIRSSSGEKSATIANLRSRLTDEVLASADKAHGRRLFQKSCGQCHQLFGEGGRLGPDLTGAQRSNIDYLLENIVDPSAVVTKEFRATVLLLKDNRVLSGLVTSKTEQVVTLATQNETYRLATDEIASSKLSNASTMPDGLLDQFTEDQTRDLFAYLQSRQALPLDEDGAGAR